MNDDDNHIAEEMLNIAVEMLNTAVDDDSIGVLVVVVDGCWFFVLDTLLTLTTSLLIPPLLTQSLWSGTRVGEQMGRSQRRDNRNIDKSGNIRIIMYLCYAANIITIVSAPKAAQCFATSFSWHQYIRGKGGLILIREDWQFPVWCMIKVQTHLQKLWISLLLSTYNFWKHWIAISRTH